MVLFRVVGEVLEPVVKATFAMVEMKERQDLQRLLRQRLDVLGDDLLFVAEEYGAFHGSQRRIDLLAMDTTSVRGPRLRRRRRSASPCRHG